MSQNSFTKDEKQAIVEKYFDMVYKLAVARTKSREYSDDVVQEVFLRFLKSDKIFESDEHLKAWLIRVTINCSHNIFTNSWAKKTVPLTDDFVFEMKEKGDVFYAAMELPKKYRTVIHLFYYEDLSIAQISKLLNTKENTIKSQLSRARDLLKDKLKGEYDGI